MRTNQEIRDEVSAMLKGNWSVAVLVALNDKKIIIEEKVKDA